MKRLLVFALCCLSAGAVLGQAETENPPVNVTLAAAPAQGQTFPGSVSLTATVTSQKFMLPKLFSVAAQRIRYSFKAQRTWPCAEEVTIAQGSSNASVAWAGMKAGEYKITVDVYYPRRGAPVLVREIAASASINTYVVRPPIGFPGNIILSASPPTQSTVSFPVNVTLSASVSPAPDPAIPNRWRFKFECQGCNPPRSNPIDGPASSANWTTSVSTPGQHNLFVYVDKVRPSDCVWEFGGLRYDYNYFLKAQ